MRDTATAYCSVYVPDLKAFYSLLTMQISFEKYLYWTLFLRQLIYPLETDPKSMKVYLLRGLNSWQLYSNIILILLGTLSR